MQTNKRSARFFFQLSFIVLFGLAFLALVDLVYSWVLNLGQSIYHLSKFLTIGLCLVTFLITITFIWLELFKINVFQRPKRLTPLRFWLLLSLCAISIIGSSYTYIMFQQADLLPEPDMTPYIVSDGFCLFFYWSLLVAFFTLIKAGLKTQ